MLHLISTAARYYSLQAKNKQQDEVLAQALPEMRGLLLEYESLLKSGEAGQP